MGTTTRHEPSVSASAPLRTEVAVLVRGLTAQVGERWLFGPLDFVADREHPVAITGPPGSGKSTVLAVLAGRPPSSVAVRGDVTVTGTAAAMPQASPTVGASLRDLLHALDPITPPEVLVELVWGDPEPSRHVIGLLDHNLRGQTPDACRLAAITHLVARHPDVLLLDEPDTGQPDDARGWIVELLGRVRRIATIVVATRRPDVGRCVADTVIELPGRAGLDAARGA